MDTLDIDRTVRLHLNDLVVLTANFLWLQNASPETYCRTEKGDGAFDRLELLQRDLIRLEITYAEQDLVRWMDILKGHVQEGHTDVDRWDEPPELLSVQFAGLVTAIAIGVWELFLNEIEQRSLFLVSHDRHADIEALLANPKRHFGIGEGSRLQLDETAEVDFVMAAHCYSLGFIPAAIMFLSRATEGVFRSYYFCITGRTPNRWKDVETKLESMKSPACLPRLIEICTELRNRRNASMHPNPYNPPEQWDINAAQTLFDLCQETIKHIEADLQVRNISM